MYEILKRYERKMNAKKSHGAIVGFGKDVVRKVRFTTDYKKLSDAMKPPSNFSSRWVPLFTSEHFTNSFRQPLKSLCFARSPSKFSFRFDLVQSPFEAKGTRNASSSTQS